MSCSTAALQAAPIAAAAGDPELGLRVRTGGGSGRFDGFGADLGAAVKGGRYAGGRKERRWSPPSRRVLGRLVVLRVTCFRNSGATVQGHFKQAACSVSYIVTVSATAWCFPVLNIYLNFLLG